MRTKDIIAGLQILMPYYEKPDGFHSGADHDVFCAYPTEKPLKEKDLAKMIELGWHQEHNERDYDEDFSAKEYREDESWHAYT